MQTIPIEQLLLISSILILISALIAKLTDNQGVPTLLIFLSIGMLAGSDGPGGIQFDDPKLSQSIGIIALTFILFAGGLDTQWTNVRPVLWPAISLSTLGVLFTTAIIGFSIALVFKISLLTAFLLAAIISSTDAAAVFAVLRSKNVSLRGRLGPLLELESGSNDPMAVFLTIGLVRLHLEPGLSPWEMILLFVFQMGVGLIAGYVLGRSLVWFLNRIKFSYEGIYPVFTLAFGAFIYGATATLGGSGFLAVYIAGLVAGHCDFVHKKSLLRFFDGLAWLSQIVMFITLGLLVSPKALLLVMGSGLLISFFLMFLARPLAVFLALMPTSFNWREKTLVSWVGLRGSVPIILATFPLLANLTQARFIFDVVFFIVLTSALLQGWSIPTVAKFLKVAKPMPRLSRLPLEFIPSKQTDTDLVEFVVPFNAAVVGKSIVELGMPKDSLIVIITRNEEFLVPSGGTVLDAGDAILALVNKTNLSQIREIFSRIEVKEKDIDKSQNKPRKDHY